MIRNDATPDTQRKDAAVWFCKYYEFDSILAFTNVDLSSPPPPLAAGKEVDYKEYGKQILKSISDTFLKPENLSKASFNDQAVIQAVGETILNFPLPEPSSPLPVNSEGWVDVSNEPDYGGEYNVLYDLEDGLEPVVSTMDFDKINHKWFDTRGANIECMTVLKWQPLPSPPPTDDTIQSNQF